MVDVATCRMSYKNAEFNQNVYFNTTHVSSNDVKFWVKNIQKQLVVKDNLHWDFMFYLTEV